MKQILLSGFVGFAIVFATLSCQSELDLKKNTMITKREVGLILQVSSLPLSITTKVKLLNLSNSQIFHLIPLNEVKSEERKLLKV